MNYTIINNIMKKVHIYKLSTYKYFLTTVPDNTSEVNKEYEYICNIDVDVDDNNENISILIYTTKENETTEIKTHVIESNKFDEFKEKFDTNLKTSLQSPGLQIYHLSNTHDVFSNVYKIDVHADGASMTFIMINSQIISNISVKQYISQQKPQIKTISELDFALDSFTEKELDVYVIELPISTNPYQTMRRSGSCMTTIYEYYIPSLNISYNFYDGINILIGDTIEDRYVERYWECEKIVKFSKTKIESEKLINTLSALKSYTNFKLSVGKLFVQEHTEENI